jgi:tetraacyldisaccharide 4'-kinase
MNPAAVFALAPFSGLYRLGVAARRTLYRRGILTTHQLAVPVISVGNLTTGGTGKTPLVEWIANKLAQRGRRVCILTRGYGRANERRRVVVSNGTEILSSVEQAGDEPLMLAERLLIQAAVVSDADRKSAADWAVANLNSDVLLLDDGFQQLRIARSLDIVTIDAARPWGNGWLLPAGRLRERPAELSRADCVVITRASQKSQSAELLSQISKVTDRPVFRSRMRLTDARPAGHSGANDLKQLAEKELRATTALAFCGLGNPQAFFTDLHDAGYNLVHTITFPDHHIYDQADIDRISHVAAEKGAQVLLTTAKDEVKLRSLRFELLCYAVDVVIDLEDEAALTQLIDDAVRKPV